MTQKYYTLICRVHKGKILSIYKDDNICASCYNEKKNKRKS